MCRWILIDKNEKSYGPNHTDRSKHIEYWRPTAIETIFRQKTGQWHWHNGSELGTYGKTKPISLFMTTNLRKKIQTEIIFETYQHKRQHPFAIFRWAESIWPTLHVCMVRLVLRLILEWNVQRTATQCHLVERQLVQRTRTRNSTACPIQGSPWHRIVWQASRMEFVSGHNRRKMTIKCSPGLVVSMETHHSHCLYAEKWKKKWIDKWISGGANRMEGRQKCAPK